MTDQWKTSTRSGEGGNCVQVRQLADTTVQLRDSKDTSGPVLDFNPTDWRTFLSHVDQLR